MGELATVRLKPGREKPLLDGHPWLYSGAVAAEEGPREAPLARVFSAAGSLLGIGFFSPCSQIRVRMLRTDEGAVDRGFFHDRLAAALRLRQQLLPAHTTGYRLVNAEGDFLPGWTIDRYGETLVSQITVAGLEALREEAYAALGDLLPGSTILQSNRGAGRRREGLPETDEVVAGEPGEEALFTESGLRFTAALTGGQKTGFYCDQRPNRRLAQRLAADRRVLDLFAHSGAFGIYALRGGAESVLAVESSPRLLERARRHLVMNELPTASIRWLEANAFETVRRLDERFELVICDPPPLARRRSEVDAAARAYKDLNRNALRRLAPGGLLMTFSCSGAVDGRLFRQILFAAAVEAGRPATLLAPLAAGPDHPVALTHPQGEYLKGWLIEAR